MKSACLVVALWSAVTLGAQPAPSAVERLAIPYLPAPDQGPTAASETTPAAGVVIMPKFDVKDDRIRLADDDVLTNQGILASAKKEYLSPVYQSVFGPLVQVGTYYLDFLSLLGGWHPNDTEALLFYQQHERLRKMGEWDDLIRLAKLTDPKEAVDLKDMEFETYRFDQEPNFTPIRGPRRHH
jgi:hypothetical protein